MINYSVEKSSRVKDVFKNNTGGLVSISNTVVRGIFSDKLIFGQRPERNQSARHEDIKMKSITERWNRQKS